MKDALHMNPITSHLMFMHICIHHYTNASPLQSSKWILIALKNETHSPTAPSKTWLLPIFLSPNLTTLLCPECSLLPSLHLVPWTCQAFPCFCILHMQLSISFFHCPLPFYMLLPSSIFVSQLKCSSYFLYLSNWKKITFSEYHIFFLHNTYLSL